MIIEDYNAIFIDNVLFLLKKNKMTRRSLCSAANISVSYFSGTLMNKKLKGNPTLEVMSKIASVFGLPLQMLLEKDLILYSDLHYINCFLPHNKSEIVREWSLKLK